jgi:maleylacetoacetate isomerase
MSGTIKLYSYWRSSAAYRVRIGLALKALPYEYVAVDLAPGSSEQFGSSYRDIEPQSQVPLLSDGDRLIRQSLAILEYIEETYELSGQALLPSEGRERARARGLAQLIACDIHPLGNLRVLRYLEQELGLDEARRLAWLHNWLSRGLAAFEALVDNHPSTGDFSEGDFPSIADCCLVPQLYNARRFKLDLEPYPNLRRIEANCLALEAFQQAAPERQPDAPQS